MVAQGDRVEKEQPLVKFDIDYIQEHATSIIPPIIFTNLFEGESVVLNKLGHDELKEQGIIVIKK